MANTSSVWLLHPTLSHDLVPGDAVKIGKWMFVKYVKSSDERIM